jgi:hypothetical protein
MPFIAEDHNDIGQQDKQREVMSKWLIKAWDFASDAGMVNVADDLTELLSHMDEPDYPVWDEAKCRGLIGKGRVATCLWLNCGMPPEGPTRTGWEKEINFAPVIYLEESVWRKIHGSLGWVNRSHDTRMPGRNFFLWSDAGNVIRFAIAEYMDVPVETLPGSEEEE